MIFSDPLFRKPGNPYRWIEVPNFLPPGRCFAVKAIHVHGVPVEVIITELRKEAEKLDNAEVECVGFGGRDPEIEFMVYGQRDLTDDEEAWLAERANEQRDADLATLARLKAQYESETHGEDKKQ